MPYRDDLGAAQAHVEALERRLEEAERENARLRGEREVPGRPGAVLLVAGALLLVAAGLVALSLAGGGFLAAAAGASAAMTGVTAAALARLCVVARPNEALVVSGGSRARADGSRAGFRIVVGGRAVVMPIVERIDRLDLRPVRFEATIADAYVARGDRPRIEIAASVSFARDLDSLGSAVERFLGRPRDEVAAVARETVVGVVRGAVATMTLEELRTDRERTDERLRQGADEELSRLGLRLESLTVRAAAG